MASSRFIFMDTLNIVACFAVIVLHCTTTVFSPALDIDWTISLVYQSIFIFAVPVFFMVSGANLLNYRARYSTNTFFKKRFSKVFGALVFASIVSYVILCVFPFQFYGASSFAGAFGLIDFVKRFLTNGIIDIYWFMYAIIYLYMLTPILSKVVGDKSTFLYLMGLCLFVSVALPFANRYIISPEYTSTLFSWPLFGTINLVYFLLGYYLNQYVTVGNIRWRWLLLSLFLSITIMIVCGFASNDCGNPGALVSYDNYWVGISSPTCVVLSATVFLILKKADPMIKNLRYSSWLPKLSSLTLWIYLFHMLVLNWANVHVSQEVLRLFRLVPLLEAVLVFLTTLAIVAGCRFGFSKVKKAMRPNMKGHE